MTWVDLIEERTPVALRNRLHYLECERPDFVAREAGGDVRFALWLDEVDRRLKEFQVPRSILEFNWLDNYNASMPPSKAYELALAYNMRRVREHWKKETKEMPTMQEVWGFSSVLAVEADVQQFCKALNDAAGRRMIDPTRPSDALDASRELLIDEAARAIGAQWSLDHETLRLARADLVVNWPTVESIILDDEEGAADRWRAEGERRITRIENPSIEEDDQ